MDGEQVRIRGGKGPLTERDREALAELVRAVKAMPPPTDEQLQRRKRLRNGDIDSTIHLTREGDHAND